MDKISAEEHSALVLVVDDDITIRLLTREALQQIGLRVELCSDGNEALSVFEPMRPDMVLLDVMMPGIDGIDVCAQLRKMSGGEHIPILMVTGVDDVESISRAYEVGATDFVTKPINWVILGQRVRYMLRASQAIDQLRKSEIRLANAQRIARLGSWEMNTGTSEWQCSEETHRILGRNDSEISIEEFLSSVHPDDREYVAQSMNRAMFQKTPFELDHRILLPDGTERVVFQRVETEIDEIGNVTQLSGTLQDITKRKQAELLEVDRNRVLEMVIRNEPLEHILLHLAHMLESQRPDSSCLLSLTCGDRIQCRAAPSLPESFVKAIDGQTIGTKIGCYGAAAYSGQTVIASDIARSPLWERQRELALSHDLKTSLSVPILSGKGQVLGTVTLFYQRPHQPDDTELRLLDMVSKLGAVSIDQRQLSEQLAHQASHDALTGLPNRVYLADYLENAIARALRHGGKIALAFIDLDRFKHVNDSLGHDVGDDLLRQVAERLRQCTRKSDILVRMGGDEFVLVLNDIQSPDDAGKMANRLLEMLTAPFDVKDRSLHISASIGISLHPEDGHNAADLQRKADIAMYHAKNQGGGRLQYFSSEMNDAVIERLEIENELRKALERGEFELHYQPQYEMQGKELVAVEALIRWNHPELGRVPPARFIPIAEESGLILQIGAWVLQEACQQNATWQQQGYGPLKIAVNISSVQFMQDCFIDEVVKALETSGLEAKWLQLELTETTVVKDIKAAAKMISELRAIGVSTAIDDFGTGYASMAYIRELPVDCLKMDRSFVREIERSGGSSKRSRALIKAFVNLADSLELRSVAEGVESWGQHEFLQAIGCELAQGFLFSVPMPASEIESVFKEHMPANSQAKELEAGEEHISNTTCTG